MGCKLTVHFDCLLFAFNGALAMLLFSPGNVSPTLRPE